MPCEILFKTDTHADGTVNYTLPDIHKDRQDVFKKGYPVMIREYPHSGWGYMEGIPYFFQVRVTDATAAEVQAAINSIYDIPGIDSPWIRLIDWVQTAEVAAIDGHRMRAWTTNPGASNLAGITRDMVENLLNNWNGFVYSAATNEVVFDVAIFADDRTILIPGALMSEGFWGFSNAPLISFSEQPYIEGSGIHEVTADYSALPAYLQKPASAERKAAIKVEERGGSIFTNVGGSIIFTISRSNVFAAFKADIKRKIEALIYKRQLKIPEAIADNIISTGIESHVVHLKGDREYRRAEVTLAGMLSFIENRLDEA